MGDAVVIHIAHHKQVDRTQPSVYNVVVLDDIVYTMPAPTRSDRAFPGEFEQMVLLAILRLREDAYGMTLRQELEERAGRSVSRGALYRTLDRMAGKKYITWSVEEPTAERGGHHRRRFRVMPLGMASLRASRGALMRLWEGLEVVLEERA